MSFPENIGISMPFVLHWPIIFRERKLGSMFLWRRLVRRFNFVPGKLLRQFQSAKRALIPGWRKTRRVEYAPRGRARQRREHDLHHHPVSSRHSRDGSLCGYGGGLWRKKCCSITSGVL